MTTEVGTDQSKKGETEVAGRDLNLRTGFGDLRMVDIIVICTGWG